MPVTLYQIAPSFYSQIARLTLTEKGVAWTERMVNIGPVMENYEPWFMRLNPKGVVPVLDHDGRIVVEALQIARYVDASFPGPALTPDDTETRARTDEWLERFARFPVRELSYGLILATPFGRVVGHSFDLRRKVLKRHIRTSPDLAPRYQARIDDIDAWQKISADPEAVVQLEQTLQDMLQDLDRDLAHGGPWLFGEQFTLADIWATVLIARLKQFWVGKPGGTFERTLPARVAAYYGRLRARPSFATADIWEGMRAAFMVRIVAPFLVPRLLGALAIVGAVATLPWLVVSG
jgi:glutathione S-transferase